MKIMVAILAGALTSAAYAAPNRSWTMACLALQSIFVLIWKSLP